MILKSVILDIIKTQNSIIEGKNLGLKRELFYQLPDSNTHALIVSGVRRCGKSTLFLQLLNEKFPDAFYFNFEHPRLYDFDKNDFLKLDEVIKESGKNVLLLDEIQNMSDWERFVRLKLDEGYKVLLNGSNAKLLSSEMGTKLTGRQITKELFPFSFSEFCAFSGLEKNEESQLKYLINGGFPDYIINPEEQYLYQLFDDILVRDIAVRFGVRDIKTLKRLALFLLSNVGNLVTGNRLKTQFGMGATSTVMEYFAHLELSYLFFFVPKFSYSVRKQLINPRKVYAIDTGLIKVNTGGFSDYYDRELENMVFLHLRKVYNEFYYFAENGECDFIIFGKNRVQKIVQVCSQLSQDNLDKELSGLFEALEFFDFEEGEIVTWNQKDRFERNGKTAIVIPFYEYVSRDSIAL